MLALYAKVYGISNADAYREICEALQTGDYAPEYQSYQNRQPQEIAQSVRASRQAIHQTLSMLFSMLSLTPKRLKRKQRKLLHVSGTDNSIARGEQAIFVGIIQPHDIFRLVGRCVVQ